MPALSVHEASKLRDGVVKRDAVVRTIETNSQLLRYLSFINLTGDTYAYNIEDKLPGVGYRGYNEGFDTSVGVINPKVEVLKILGGDIDVDRRLVMTRGPIVRNEQEQSKVRAMAFRFNSDFVNGDSDEDPRYFDGIRKRVSGKQIIPADLASPTTNSPLSLQALDKAIDQVLNPSAIIVSPTMLRRISKAAQKNLGGDIVIDKDMFGFRTTFYNGLPLISLGYDEESNEVMKFDEAGPAGGAVSTSVYVVSFGNDGVRGLQNGGIMIDDLGELQALPVYRTRIEWQLGLAVHHGRAIARIWGITDAAVTE